MQNGKKDSDWFKTATLLILSALYDMDPTGEKGMATASVYIAMQEHGVRARDWAWLVLMLTGTKDDPLCRQKGHTLYLTARGRELGRKVSERLAAHKAA